jgi:Tfp pilus assembly protein PilV
MQHAQSSPRSRLRSQKGFTILEVAMAAAVMAMSISSSILVMGRGFNNLDSARCFSYSSQIMQSELEKMRLTKWGDGTAAGNGTDGVTAYPTSVTVLPIDASFTTAGDVGSRMTMTRIAENVHTGMIKVTLRISWTTSDGRPMSRSYITYYGQNGLYDYFVL